MNFLSKHKKKLVAALDALLVLGAVVSRFLTDYLVTTDKPCDWTLVGAQCGTCGGTRCVNHLLSGDIIGAFQLNPYVFMVIVYAVVSVVFLNLMVYTRQAWPEKALRKMYNLKMFFVAVGSYVLFIILRNLRWIIVFFTLLAGNM